MTFARNESSLLTGSCRSIPGFHIKDALDRIAVEHSGLLLKFGGHAMAAGLTIEEQELVRFREAFDRLAREHFKNNG